MMLPTQPETAKEIFYGLILHTIENVETKVGKIFLSLIDAHFRESNPLHKIFNRNTLKLGWP